MRKSPNGWVQRMGKEKEKINKKTLRSIISTGRHSLVACEFIKTRLINYARPISSSATFPDFSANLRSRSQNVRIFIRRRNRPAARRSGKYAMHLIGARARVRSFQKVSSPSMLILLPESQRIKHDTRTIALHDHQVTFTLSSHPLAVYPVKLGAGRPKKNRPECAKARKLSSYGNSRVWRKLFNVFVAFFRPSTAARVLPGIYLIDAIAKCTSNEFRICAFVSHNALKIEIRGSIVRWIHIEI